MIQGIVKIQSALKAKKLDLGALNRKACWETNPKTPIDLKN